MLLAVVLLAITARSTGFLLNFSPVAAICLFSAAMFASRWKALGVSLLVIAVSDLALYQFQYAAKGYSAIYPGMAWQYAGYALMVVLGGFTLKKLTLPRLVGSSLGASLLFFVISNFGTWASTAMYEKSLAGLTQCYVAAIPFFRGTLTGDLCYTAVFFGSFLLAQHWQQNATSRRALSSQH